MKQSRERKEDLRKQKRRQSMMSALQRMSRFNGSVFFMSRAKYTRARSRAGRHMGGWGVHVRARRSDEGTEKNV